MKRVIFALTFILSFVNAQELQLHQADSDNQKLSAQTQASEEVSKNTESESGIRVGKNFLIKTDTFANEGFSEAELEMSNANLNEIEAPMSRYGAGIELNYSIKPNSRTKLEIFASNALELNMQRRGGKVKTYDNGIRYEENAYNYGDKSIYSAWTNSIGVALTILKAHHIILTFKQTHSSGYDLLTTNFSVAQFDSTYMGNVIPINTGMGINPWLTTTQIFLTYSYVF